MKNLEVLKELKAIKELMDNNIVSAWHTNLRDTSEAVILSDFVEGLDEEEEAIEYNGWHKRLSKLIDKLEMEEQKNKEV